MSKATRNEAGRQQTFAAGEDMLREVRDELMVRMRMTMLNFVKQLFDEEREALIGEKWSRKREGQAHSGGTERGSIYLEGRRVPVKYPRIADARGSHEPSAYRALRSYDLMSESVLGKTVRGISNRDFEGTVSDLAVGTGLSRSSVSRAFKRASQKSLDQINGKRPTLST